MIRAGATANNRTIITTLQAFSAAVQAIDVRLGGTYDVCSLQRWDELRAHGNESGEDK